MMRTKIVFDNDGVNIDSETAAMRVMDNWGVAFLSKYKPEVQLPKDHIYRTYPGTSTDKIVEALITKFDLPVEQIKKDNALPKDATVPQISIALADIVTLETIEHFKKELKSILGATQALTEIHRMFGSENVALATTSRKDRMDVSLAYAADPVTGQNARLDEMFPKGPQRYSGYDVSNKYDAFFKLSGWDASKAIVVEDSLSGVSKAMAGRPDTAVIGTVAAQFYEDKPAQAAALLEKGAKIVISDMADLPRAAGWLKAGMELSKKPEFKSPVYLPATAERPATKSVAASIPAQALGSGSAA